MRQHLPKNRSRARLHRGLARLALACLALAVPALAAAQTVFMPLGDGDAPVRRVTVAPGYTVTVETDERFADIVVGNPEVADVLPLTDSSLYIQGVSSGFTNLAFYNDASELTGVLDVRVRRDFTELEEAIGRAVPSAQVEVMNLNDRIRLSGQVKNAVDLQRVLEIADQYSEEPIVNAMRVATAQQVELQVRVLEVERNAGRALGVDLEGTDGPEGFTTGVGLLTGQQPFGTVVGDLLEVAGLDVDIVIRALETKGLARRLSNPNLVTTSGVPANFVVGGEIPISSAVAGDNGLVAEETDYREYGVRLSFLPTVLDEGLISLRVQPEVSDIDPSITVNGQPAFTSRKADTTVTLRDGQSFAIAGLLDANNARSVEQVPWLGQVPVIGTLFRSTSFQKQETDLVILVTPHLVRPAAPDTPLRSPLDATRPSNDVELFLLGMLEVDKDLLRNFREGNGIVGPYGHILDLEFGDEVAVKK